MRLNPVLRRELVERWRGRRAVATLTGYLAVLGLLLFGCYRLGLAILDSELANGFGGVDAVTAGPALGRFLFDSLLASVLMLVLFVSPGYAAAQLSGERERRTLQLLQVTLLRPRQIVLGKLGASVAWLTLLVTATLPLAAATLFLGGVAVVDLVRSVAFVVAIAIGVAGMALGVSAVARRTAGAVVLTYGLVLALTLGTLFTAGLEGVLIGRGDGVFRTPWSVYANPLVGLADAANAGDGGFAGLGGIFFGGPTLPSPLGLLAQVLPSSQARDLLAEEQFVDGGGGGPVLARPLPAEEVEEPSRQPVWLIVAGIYLGLGLLGLVVAARRVRPGRVSRRRGHAAPPAPAAGAPPIAPVPA